MSRPLFTPLVLVGWIASWAVLAVGAVRAQDPAVRFLAFGDSITLGVGFDDCECQCPEACGYPHRLELLLREAGVDASVTNAGIGGETTAEGVTRIGAELPGHDVLLLMEGTNDLSNNVSVETVLFNLNAMAEAAEGLGVGVVHATLIPRIPMSNADGDNWLNERLAWRVRELAYNRGRGLADPFEVFGSAPHPFENLYAEVNGDPVGHPNPAGFQLLAEIFFDVLEGVDSVPPVVGLVEPADGSNNVPANAEIRLILFDFGEGIDFAATDLLINGEPVSAGQGGSPQILSLTYQPPGGLQGVVRVGYQARDLAIPPNQVQREVARFVVAGTSFLVGDINRDGRVDGADLVRLALAFGARRGQARYDAAADLDDDGVIDGVDLALLASNFGRTAE